MFTTNRHSGVWFQTIQKPIILLGAILERISQIKEIPLCILTCHITVRAKPINYKLLGKQPTITP